MEDAAIVALYWNRSEQAVVVGVLLNLIQISQLKLELSFVHRAVLAF